MAGKLTDQARLNYTLCYYADILLAAEISDWFIGYGTLLGLIREENCIDGDDDVDILINKIHYDQLKMLLDQRNVDIEYGHGIGKSRDILKTKPTSVLGSIDFYCCKVDGSNYHDIWERAIWYNCLDPDTKKFPIKKWRNRPINIPHRAIEKLECRYGEWRKPSKSKKAGKSPNKLL
jgi:hypothetical protein